MNDTCPSTDAKPAADPTRTSEIAYTPSLRSADFAATTFPDDGLTRNGCGALGTPSGRPHRTAEAARYSYWRTTMEVRNAAQDVMAAVAVMEHARNACANLSPLGQPMTDAQIEHRARMIAAVIEATRKLRQLRDRAASLESALARFRARRAELAA
jgi:hypothetical protein